MAKQILYNIPTLSFLLGSYTGMLESFGKNPKTVEFFRNQVNGLINIHQVSRMDAELIFDIIGMQNTNNVKWVKSEEKIRMFIQTMNIMETFSTDEKIQVIKLTELLKSGNITDDIYQKIIKIYGLTILEQMDRPINNSFGVLNKSNVSNVGSSTDSTAWRSFVNRYGDYYYKVKNPNAVCSCDPSYFYCKVSELQSAVVNNSRNRVLELLIKGSDLELCLKDENNDGCHISTYYKKDADATLEAKKFDYTKFA